MTLQAEEIQRRMSSVRKEMNEDVVVLVESARSLLDWKGYVTTHPIVTLGAASAAGYLLVPKKSVQTGLEAGTDGVLKNSKRNQVAVTNSPAVQPKPSFLSGAISALAGIAIRTAVAKTTQHFQDAFSANLDHQTSSVKPPSVKPPSVNQPTKFSHERSPVGGGGKFILAATDVNEKRKT
jgi:hypothetical protein